MFNPTGGEIRVDPAGDGHFGTGRGSHTHRGLDLTIPTFNVWAPIEGVIERHAYPYVGDKKWQGCLIQGTGRHLPFNCKLFYVVVDDDLVGKLVTGGERIGDPQKISKKYPGQGMIDHVHFEVYFKPFMLMNKYGSWNMGPVYVNPAIFLGIDTYTKGVTSG